MSADPTKQLTQREKQLLMFLPAIFAVIIYFWIFTKEPSKKLKTLMKQVETAERVAPKQRDLEGEMMRGATIQRESQEVQKTLEKIQGELSQYVSAWSNATASVTTGDELSALWRRHDLVLIENVKLNESEVSLSPRMARVAAHLRPALGAGAPHTWEARLQGGYLPLMHALRELGESRLMVLPLSISMTNSPDGATLIWNLKLWM